MHVRMMLPVFWGISGSTNTMFRFGKVGSTTFLWEAFRGIIKGGGGHAYHDGSAEAGQMHTHSLEVQNDGETDDGQ